MAEPHTQIVSRGFSWRFWEAARPSPASSPDFDVKLKDPLLAFIAANSLNIFLAFTATCRRLNQNRFTHPVILDHHLSTIFRNVFNFQESLLSKLTSQKTAILAERVDQLLTHFESPCQKPLTLYFSELVPFTLGTIVSKFPKTKVDLLVTFNFTNLTPQLIEKVETIRFSLSESYLLKQITFSYVDSQQTSTTLSLFSNLQEIVFLDKFHPVFLPGFSLPPHLKKLHFQKMPAYRCEHPRHCRPVSQSRTPNLST